MPSSSSELSKTPVSKSKLLVLSHMILSVDSGITLYMLAIVIFGLIESRQFLNYPYPYKQNKVKILDRFSSILIEMSLRL
jgi:hypothetical protein